MHDQNRLLLTRRSPWTMVASLTLALFGLGQGVAQADALTCVCQTQLVCGADSCDPAEIEVCGSTDIKLSLAEPSISLCAFSQCLEGPATLTTTQQGGLLLSGSYRPSTAPAVNPSSVVLYYDETTGVAFAQTTDEEAVAQYSLICGPVP